MLITSNKEYEDALKKLREYKKNPTHPEYVKTLSAVEKYIDNRGSKVFKKMRVK